MPGIFITVEGGDGSGKSTQISMLAEHFRGINYKVVVTREPGGTKISEKIRSIILDNANIEMSSHTEALLYAAARAQHVAEVIRPALLDGALVLCDRFVDSSIIYQGLGRGLGQDAVEAINNFGTSGLTPDITFFLDIPPALGLKRKKKTADLDRLESESLQFHENIYAGYKVLAEKFRDRIRVIDATGDALSIHNSLVADLEQLFKRRVSYETSIGNHTR